MSDSRLCEIAVTAIEFALGDGVRRRPPLAGLDAALAEPGASFVTLERQGQLLGCVGTLEARQPLAWDVAEHALGAAFDDPRLPPLTDDDFPEMSVKVSVLSRAERVTAESFAELRVAVQPDVDGLTVEAGRHRATLLPSVWPKVRDRDEFLAVLWAKAGLPPGAWPHRIVVSRYRTTEEHDPGPRAAGAQVVSPPVTEPLCTLDFARMRRARIEKLRASMETAGIDVLLLCGHTNVSYATGARIPAADHMRASWWRPVAVLERGAEWPHLYTEFEGAPVEIPDEFVHPAIEVETRAGAAELAGHLAAGVLALDDAPFALWEVLRGRAPVDAGVVLAPAKLMKTLDELECIRQAQAINERAMREVRAAAVPGARATDLSGIFLRAIIELGATANTVDPVFQVMPRFVAAGPYTVTGEIVFPLPTRPQELGVGDVLWVDTGINLHGYASDFGATWFVGAEPDDQQRVQHAQWRDVVDHVLQEVRPGATAADLVRAARLHERARPWLSYFYLAHGLGTDSAEMPFVGTDLGDEFDASLVLAPGMVLVLEPVIWQDGHAGQRSEEIVAVTDDGYVWLSSRADLDEGGAA